MALIDELNRIRQRLKKGAFSDEEEAWKESVSPVLRELGWNTTDSRQVQKRRIEKIRRVRTEHGVENPHGRRGDTTVKVILQGKKPEWHYRLLIGENLKAVIEAKAGSKIEAKWQSPEYVPIERKLFAILTNGNRWLFYLREVIKNEEAKRYFVCTLSIAENNLNEVEESLCRYLHRRAICNESAFKYAENAVLENQKNRQKARKAIPQIWHRLYEDIDDKIVRLLMKEVQNVVGILPDEDDVITFLRGLAPSETPPPLKESKRSQPRTPKTGEVVHITLGKKYTARNKTEAYVNIICILAKHDSTFLGRLEPRFVGRRRKHLARRKIDISPTEAVQEYARKLPQGWWLDTNLSTAQKSKLLNIAYRVSGREVKQNTKPDTAANPRYTTGAPRIRGVDNLPSGTRLRASYDGHDFEGEVRNGNWHVEGRVYKKPSPSGVLKKEIELATGKIRSINGWPYWKVQFPGSGGWTPINTLR